MTGLTATATCRAFAGTVETTGGVLTEAGLAERVGWLSALTASLTGQVLAARWNPADLAVLAAGVGSDGRRLPSNGWMAVRRLGWGVPAAAPGSGAPVSSDRVRRIAEEHAARLLRVALHRDTVVRAIGATWPADPKRRTAAEWAALWVLCPSATKAEVRNRTRQAATHLKTTGALPVSVMEAEPPPRVHGQVLLSAADRQQVTFARDPRDPGRAVLRVLMPAVAVPASYRDWQWVTVPVRLPANVTVGAALHVPTLRLVRGGVRVDVPWTVEVPPAVVRGHVRALGLDWGVNTLLTGTVARLATERSGRPRVVSSGRPLVFDAAGVSAKIVRLRTVREEVRTRLDHLTLLADGRTRRRLPADPDLVVRHGRLTAEHERVCARIRNLDRALAWGAARWAVDQALANGCTAVYVEDLTTMEAGGMGRSLNRRVGGQVRGTVFAAITHLAARHGIAVVTVPAAGTSSGCPRCGATVEHVKAPDLLEKKGRGWAACPCGMRAGRDHAAAERIVGRGLLGQHAARRTKTGLVTTKSVDGNVRRTPSRRDKTAPTPRRARRGQQVSCPSPSRRRVPAPATTPSVVGQRPAGRTPQDGSPIAAQVPHTITYKRGHTRDRRLGRGFHPHLRATPPRIS